MDFTARNYSKRSTINHKRINDSTQRVEARPHAPSAPSASLIYEYYHKQINKLRHTADAPATIFNQP
jgi:hypothetical protein